MVKVYNIYIDDAYFENGLKLKNLRVCCVVRIDRTLTVTAIRGNLIVVQELTSKSTASYHWFVPTNFEVIEVQKKHNKYAMSVVKLNYMETIVL